MHIWENDQIGVRIDKTDQTTTLETNSGGLLASYVTVHLSEAELEELIGALVKAKNKLNT